MTKINPNRLKFYQFLNDDIDIEIFENWVYSNNELENEIQIDHYNDLISFNFKSSELKKYIKTLIKKLFSWSEFEKWRTIELFQKIKSGEIETVLATRKLRELYIEQEIEMDETFISISLGKGYESVLDSYPTENEYKFYNKEYIKQVKEEVLEYKKCMIRDIDLESKKMNKN